MSREWPSYDFESQSLVGGYEYEDDQGPRARRSRRPYRGASRETAEPLLRTENEELPDFIRPRSVESAQDLFRAGDETLRTGARAFSKDILVSTIASASALAARTRQRAVALSVEELFLRHLTLEEFLFILYREASRRSPSARRSPSLRMPTRRPAFPTLRVFCGTWNVNGKKPMVDLEPWLFPDGRFASPTDLFIIGLQEVQSLSKLTAVMTDAKAGKAWAEQIQRTLRHEYVNIVIRQLVGIVLLAFVRRGSDVREIMAADAGTGFLNVVGNKGGIAARFCVNGVSISCVSSHLAAHDENIAERNQNFQDILRRATFVPNLVDDAGNYEPLHILDHDVVFWLGDMNYRINLPVQEVLHLIRDERWLDLAKYDQLKTEMKALRVAPGFEEGRLNFAPTYKYEVDRNTYKMDEEGGMKRTPAWTDRILWRSARAVRLIAYRRHEVLTSDHRPVSAIFDVPILRPSPGGHQIPRRPEPEVRENMRGNGSLDAGQFLHADVIAASPDRFSGDGWGSFRTASPEMSRLSRISTSELSNSPAIQMRREKVTIPQMSYGQRVKQSVVVTCVSKVPAKVAIDSESVPNWCTVTFREQQSSIELQPHQRTEVVILAYVTKAGGLAESLTFGDKTLLANVVFDVDDGHSAILQISGSYLPSCFGVPLERLAKCRDPLRRQVVEGSLSCAVPKELWALGEAVVSASRPFPPTTDNMADYDRVRELVDSGRPLSRKDFAGACACIVAFLYELPEPVLTAATLDKYDGSRKELGSYYAAEQALSELHPVRRNVVVYLSALLRALPGAHDNKRATEVLSAALFQDATPDAGAFLMSTPLSIAFDSPAAIAMRQAPKPQAT